MKFLSKLVFIIGVLFSVPGLSQMLKPNQVLLTPMNTIVFRGEVDGNTVSRAQLELAALVAKRAGQPYFIYLVLDTPGGSIDDGEDFIQMAKTVPMLKTITLFAASMGSAIVEALPGERLVTSNGVYMFHRAKGGLQGQFEDGELEVRLEFYKKLVRGMEQRSADRMSMSLVDYKKLVKDEFWTYGSESIKNKTADRVVEVICSKELIAKKENVEMSLFFFSVTLEYSGCPLIRVGKAVEPEEKEELKKAKNLARALGYDLNARHFLNITN